MKQEPTQNNPNHWGKSGADIVKATNEPSLEELLDRAAAQFPAFYCDPNDAHVMRALCATAARELRERRSQALEEAARVAEQYNEGRVWPGVAAAIRALKLSDAK